MLTVPSVVFLQVADVASFLCPRIPVSSPKEERETGGQEKGSEVRKENECLQFSELSAGGKIRLVL